jgi:hypothetical protein
MIHYGHETRLPAVDRASVTYFSRRKSETFCGSIGWLLFWCETGNGDGP